MHRTVTTLQTRGKLSCHRICCRSREGGNLEDVDSTRGRLLDSRFRGSDDLFCILSPNFRAFDRMMHAVRCFHHLLAQMDQVSVVYAVDYQAFDRLIQIIRS